ncbi:hypothetical protein [Metabacillus idriensis]|uniref:hypothetical protein n=1 Tax=Metabacillus idriensis TaxID=324768 RepID=UPI0017497390|nr:hypothetical protein [Metabacillus idriensis]
MKKAIAKGISAWYIIIRCREKATQPEKRKVKITLDFKMAICYIDKASLEANDL